MKKILSFVLAVLSGFGVAASDDSGADLERDPFVLDVLGCAEMRDEDGHFIATAQAGGTFDETIHKAVFINDDIFSVLLEHYYYYGGGHPSRILRGGSFGRISGKKLTLDDIAPGERRMELAKRIKQALIARLNVKDEKALMEMLQKEPAPTENFYFAKDGLHVIYNEYEIACYAMGYFDLCIDWPLPAPAHSPER